MNNTQQGNYLNSLNIIYYALMAGVLVFFFVVYLQYQQLGNIPKSDDWSDILTYLVPVLCVIQIVFSYFVFQQRLKKIVILEDLKQKAQLYRELFIIRMALLEGAGIFAVAAYYFTASNAFALWTCLVLGLMSTQRPSPQNLKKYLKLSAEDLENLEKL